MEEVLYPAMEDFQLDIVLGKGPAAQSIRLDLPRFTLVAATTRTSTWRTSLAPTRFTVHCSKTRRRRDWSASGSSASMFYGK